MKKKINVKPITELELCFDDGKSIELKFSTEATLRLQEIEGGYGAFIKSTPSEMCARVIFSSCTDDEMTLEQARVITSNFSPSTVSDILSEYTETNISSNDGGQKELQKKLMEQFLNSLK